MTYLKFLKAPKSYDDLDTICGTNFGDFRCYHFPVKLLISTFQSAAGQSEMSFLCPKCSKSEVVVLADLTPSKVSRNGVLCYHSSQQLPAATEAFECERASCLHAHMRLPVGITA